MRRRASTAAFGGAGSRFDPDILKCRALVIDANPTSRSIQATQLRDLGVGTIVQCGRVQVRDSRFIGAKDRRALSAAFCVVIRNSWLIRVLNSWADFPRGAVK